MGRAFEYRKARKLKRWGHMARTFTKIGKEITLAVIAGGPDPSSNLRLRLLMQTAKSESMPKDNVERAIKRATDKDTSAYKEVVYDGKGPHGTAFVVETATDNPTRTVANIRAAFVRGKGELGTMGMNDFMFERKCSFVVPAKEGIDVDAMELELIDYDIDELFVDEGEINIYADFKNYGPISKYLEDNGYEIQSFKFERIPLTLRELTAEQMADVEGLVERLENDDDVVNVYHNAVSNE
ncbi:MAG: YebC/PmpR family DNA-binding transcriptional regulator [Bacteroidales bacterium]|nr:YebC/PmpR family DNA-binding transcriptional regulator [Bacteroidales bacterium]